MAAPVFKEIADNIYARDIQLHMAMDKRRIDEPGVFPVIRAGNQEELTMLCNELGVSNHSQTEEEWVRSSKNGGGVNWKKTINGKDVVPDVMGMTFRDAIYLLERSGMRVSYDGKGRVAEQSIIPGTHIGKGARIYLRLS